MDTKHMPHEGDRFGNWIIERTLDRGGMGMVYLAYNPGLGRNEKVALKVLDPAVANKDPDFVKRFYQEAAIAFKTHSPNLVSIHDAGRDAASGYYYIVMEYLGGGSLRDRMRREGPMPWREALPIVRQVAVALSAVAQRKSVHRDIKPENIMFTSDGVVKLADFGIAKATQDDVDTMLETMPAQVFGTPAYMSPEQVKDSSSVDARADIWSLGVVLFEMLAGVRPYPSANLVEVATYLLSDSPIPNIRTFTGISTKTVRHLSSLTLKTRNSVNDQDTCATTTLARPDSAAKAVPTERLRDIPEALAGLLRRMCEKNLDRRIASSEEVIAAIDAILGMKGGTGSFSRRLARIAAVAGAAILLAAAGVMAVHQLGVIPSVLPTGTAIVGKPTNSPVGGHGVPSVRGQKDSGVTESIAVVVSNAVAVPVAGTNAVPSRDDVRSAEQERFKLELEKTRRLQKELERQKKDLERQSEIERQKELERQKKELERQKEQERQKKELERQRELARQKELERQEEIARQKEREERERTQRAKAENAEKERAEKAKKERLEKERKVRERQELLARLKNGSEFAPNPPERVAGERKSVKLPNGHYMAFRWCPPGRFLMGSPDDEEARDSGERRHLVTLTRGFWIGETEVTREEWKALMGDQDVKWRFSAVFSGDGKYPMDNVSWEQCREFCQRLGKSLKCVMRLPTEAEWEYACRAGTSTPFSFGIDLNGDKASCAGATSPYGTVSSVGANDYSGTCLVTSFQRNPWGIYDMHGNLSEWCSDWYGKYLSEDTVDPIGPENGSARVVRGGCWREAAKFCRAACRGRKFPVAKDPMTGFRVCLEESSESAR